MSLCSPGTGDSGATPTATLRHRAFAAAQPSHPCLGVRRMRLTRVAIRARFTSHVQLLPVQSLRVAKRSALAIPGIVVRPKSGAMFVFRSVQNTGPNACVGRATMDGCTGLGRNRIVQPNGRIRRTGFVMRANHRLSGRSMIAKAQKVLFAAARGETHASNGRPWTGRTGLGRSRDCAAQWVHGGPVSK
jgi:hypothetical protein